MVSRVRTKSAQTKFSPVDLLANEAMKRINARQKPIDFRPDDPIGWIEDHFMVPRDEVPDMHFRLAPYQKKALTEALSRDENGLFKYSVILWSDIKKSVKSTLAAAVMLWRAWHTDYAMCYVVANTREQADSRVAFYLRRCIELNPGFRSVCKVNTSSYTIDFPNHARIQSIPVNSAGQAGANPTLVSFTELWGATSKDAVRMWTETATPPALIGKSFKFIDSYAGFSGESVLLEQLYNTGVVQGHRIDDEIEMYVNENARMFTLWNTTPRLPWQTEPYYRSEEAILTPSEFRRIHRNTWSSASNAFVPPEWWNACQGDIPPYNNEPCVIAMDAAVVDDCFAIVMLSKVAGEDKYIVRYAQKWTAPLGGKIDFEGPELEIRRLCKEYHVIQITYDAYQLESTAMRLMQDGVGYFYAFSQGAKRLVADKQTYDGIRDRRIVHNGNPDLSEHVFNANASTVTGQIDQLRIIKRAQHLKIDLCVALSMCYAECLGFNLP